MINTERPSHSFERENVRWVPDNFKIPETKKFNRPIFEQNQENIPQPISNDLHKDSLNHTIRLDRLEEGSIDIQKEIYKTYSKDCSESIQRLKLQQLSVIDKIRLTEIEHQIQHLTGNTDNLARLKYENKELASIHANLMKMLNEEEAVAERIAELESKIQTLEAEIKKVARSYEALYESHFAGFHNTSFDFRVEKTTFEVENYLGGKILIGNPTILEDGRCVYEIENISQNKTYRIILNERIPAIDNDGLVVSLGTQKNEFFDKEKGSNIIEIEGTVNHIDHSNQIRVISLVQEREKLKEELNTLKSNR